MVARKTWTREWFDTDSKNHELVTSATVLMELEQGDFPGRIDAIDMISNFSPLPITVEVEKIVEEYIKRLLMPSNPPLDAVHLALASYYECDFLLTWNCKHLANANKFDNIAKVNAILGLSNPKLVTPLQLLDGA